MESFSIILLLNLIVALKFADSNFERSQSDCIGEREAPTNCKSYWPFSSIDGTCNNLEQTNLGASNTPLQRYLPAKYFDSEGFYLPLGHPEVVPTKYGSDFPTAQEVFDKLFKVLQRDIDNEDKVSSFHVTFGQFLDHDLSLSNNPGGCKDPQCRLSDFEYPCFPIPKSRANFQNCTKFTRSFPTCKQGVRNQNNIITSYIDASMVYGNNEERLRRVKGGNGTLKMSPENLLPTDDSSNDMCRNRTGKCFLAGDVRVNEHIGLVGLHTIFARLHNYYAKKLRQMNFLWTSERVFQEARRIVIAIFQHITYTEYVPTLATLSRYTGYKIWVNPTIPAAFSTAAFRFAHSQVKNHWGQLNYRFEKIQDDLPLRATFFNNTVIYTHGIENTIFGLLQNKSELVDSTFSSGVAEHLFIPPKHKGHQNLVAFNIQRGRDHGLPGYNEWRKWAGLGCKQTFYGFRDHIKEADARSKLKEVYNNTDNHVDLFVAGLLEQSYNGKLVGRTFQAIIKKTFEDLRDGDRFWYQRKRIFTKPQFKEIQKMTMAKVLCLTLKGIVSIQQDVFFTFDKAKNRRYVCRYMKKLNIRRWDATPERYGYSKYYESNFDRENNEHYLDQYEAIIDEESNFVHEELDEEEDD